MGRRMAYGCKWKDYVLVVSAAMMAWVAIGLPPTWVSLVALGVLAVLFVILLLVAGASRQPAQEGILQASADVTAAALRGYALAMLDVGRLADALPAVRLYLAQMPTDVRMRAVLAVLYGAQGDRPQALAEYDRVVRMAHRVWEQRAAYLAPYMACLYAAYAAALKAAGQTDEAEALRRDALRLDPGLAQRGEPELAQSLLTFAREDELERRAFEDLPQWEQGRALALPFGLTEGAEAVAFYRPAAAQRPDSARVRDDLALALHSVGDHARAEREFQEALRLDGQDPWPRFHYGLMLWRREQLAEAERELAEAARIAPRQPGIRGTLGVFYMRQQRYAEAERELLGALTVRPDIWALARLYGSVALRQGKLDLAARAFEEAERLGANDVTFRLAYAELREQLGQIEPAEQQYRAALRLGVAGGPVHASYGGFLLRQSRLREAEQELEQAVLLPDSEAAHVHLVRLLLLERRLDDVMQHMQAALQMDPDSTVLKEAQAEWLLLRGRATEADELTLQLVRNAAPSAAVQLVRGGALLMLGRQVEAQAALREALRLDPNLPQRLRKQARALADLGRANAGLEALGQALALRPDWPEALAERDALATQLAQARPSGRLRTFGPRQR